MYFSASSLYCSVKVVSPLFTCFVVSAGASSTAMAFQGARHVQTSLKPK